MQVVTIENKNGLRLSAISLGASIVEWSVPDRKKKFQNIVLNYKSLDKYLNDPFYLGCVVGRYAGRIAQGRYFYQNQIVQLNKNEKETTHLHGGNSGWNKKNWKCAEIDANFVEFHLLSPNGDQGYPSEVFASVRYTLTESDQLQVDYRAKLSPNSKPTPINLTQHSYFNLTGSQETSIENDFLYINADQYLPVENNLIPTGEIRNVNGTSFDLNLARRVGKVLEVMNLDCSWIIHSTHQDLRLAAKLYNQGSGRLLTVYTTEPSVHVYDGSGLSTPFKKNSGICLETQHFPDSPNQPHFPSTFLEEGKEFKSCTVFEMRIENENFIL